MTEQRIIEEMAKLEGWVACNDGYENWIKTDSTGYKYLSNTEEFDYLTSHDAVQRIIDGLDEKFRGEYCNYRLELDVVCIRDNVRLHKATPRQKCEAILKAKGLWED